MLLFDQDGWVDFYATASEASQDLEAVDVRDGEYVAVYGLDGEAYDLGLTGKPHHEVPVLTATGQRDPVRLQGLLHAAQQHAPSWVTSTDPATFVNARAMHDWERRRLRWPSWLDRRLHGAAPALLPMPES